MSLWNFGSKGPKYKKRKRLQLNWGFWLFVAAIVGAIILFATK